MPATIDGYGAFRTRDGLLAALRGDPIPAVLRYRPATAADERLLLAWRNDPATRAASRRTEVVDAAAHARWLADVLTDPERVLLVAERAGEPAARFASTCKGGRRR